MPGGESRPCTFTQNGSGPTSFGTDRRGRDGRRKEGVGERVSAGGWVGAIGEEFGNAKADETENGATFKSRTHKTESLILKGKD